MVESNVSDEAASTVPPLITAGSTKLKSSVWADFEYKAGEGRAAAMATCRWCDKTLCAGGRNGSSHLRRHSKRCRERWRQQTTAPAAAGPSLGDQEAFYLVNGLNIQQLFDELDSTDLVHIDPASDDAHFLPNFVFILLFILMFSSLHMQTCRALSLFLTANSSSRWFFQKTRERQVPLARSSFVFCIGSISIVGAYNRQGCKIRPVSNPPIFFEFR
jgi:hypothetical protein